MPMRCSAVMEAASQVLGDVTDTWTATMDLMKMIAVL